LRTFALAGVAQDGCIDGDLFANTGVALGEIELHADESVVTRAHTRFRPTHSCARTTEELLENIPQAATAEAARESACATIIRLCLGVTAGIDDASLLRIGQHLLGDFEFVEFVSGLSGIIDIGVILPRLASESFLNVRVRSISVDA
jgi:hypothetical protein